MLIVQINMRADIFMLAWLQSDNEVAIYSAAYRFLDLAAALAGGTLIHPRSAVIIAYALCGFAHFASMAIFIGGVSALAPERTKVLSQIGLRALAAATLACLMTACIAGAFFTEHSILGVG